MTTENIEKATLGGGCFWCLEAVFHDLRGVKSAISGYMGGHVVNPTYNDVCGGRTGHVEVVQVTYDAAQLSYSDLLKVFFAIHDPTTVDRQGNDVGPQYRSAIFTHDEGQATAAREVIADLESQNLFANPFVTEVLPLETFYVAEDYHQRYFERNPNQPYCQAVVGPKLGKFRKQFLEKLART
jgi:peptide-methionine (S)-S-oxide reductase